jgi:hypothetical protein
MPGVLDTALCGKVNPSVSDLRQVGGSPNTPVSSTNKANRQEVTEILLKVALNIKFPNPIPNQLYGAKPNNKLIRT